VLALIPFFPLIGFVINAALGRRLPKAISGAIASAVMVASFAVSVMSVLTLVGLPVSERVIEQTVYTWIASGDFVVDMTLRLDPLAAVMILVVTGIGALIHIYSTAYMH
jgi:NADH-quinone oxidoreductase subunit L